MLTGDCLNFSLPVVSPDRGVVLLYPVAGIGAMLSTHPVTQWWRDRALLPQRGAGRVGRPHYHQGVPLWWPRREAASRLDPWVQRAWPEPRLLSKRLDLPCSSALHSTL